MGKYSTPIEVIDEDNIPQELLDAREDGREIQVESAIGFITIDDPDFRCMLEYRYKI